MLRAPATDDGEVKPLSLDARGFWLGGKRAQTVQEDSHLRRLIRMFEIPTTVVGLLIHGNGFEIFLVLIN